MGGTLLGFSAALSRRPPSRTGTPSRAPSELRWGFPVGGAPDRLLAAPALLMLLDTGSEVAVRQMRQQLPRQFEPLHRDRAAATQVSRDTPLSEFVSPNSAIFTSAQAHEETLGRP